MSEAARRRSFEEALNLFRAFKEEQITEAKELCEKSLNEPSEYLKKEFKGLLDLIQSWLEYNKKSKKK